MPVTPLYRVADYCQKARKDLSRFPLAVKSTSSVRTDISKSSVILKYDSFSCHMQISNSRMSDLRCRAGVIKKAMASNAFTFSLQCILQRLSSLVD